MQNQNKFVGNSQSFKFAPRLFNWIPPLFMCCNIHHFGITKRKVMALKLQVSNWHQNYKLRHQNYKLRHQNFKLRPQNYKLRPQNYKLRVQNLQVWPLKLYYNFLKRCFECTVNGSLQMVVVKRRAGDLYPILKIERNARVLNRIKVELRVY